MSLSKKGKRKIIVNSQVYYWWVFNEHDQNTFDGNQIKIVSEDQTFNITYAIHNDTKRIVQLELYRDKGKIQIECPKFENESGIITPSGISKLIQWICTKPTDDTPRKITFGYNKKGLNELESNALYKNILEKITKKA